MYFFVVVVFFFFSSRRRHTRSLCDWSSDVCSSDLLGAVGLDNPVPIVSFVPLMMFAILFGLSMDYEVFLMSRMQEHFRQSHDNHEAVVDGLASTALVITYSALIMVCVVCVFIRNRVPTVKLFGKHRSS